MKKCPRCSLLKMHDDDILNSLSKRDNQTYVCNDCGNDEALIDSGYMEIDDRERNFNKRKKVK